MLEKSRVTTKGRSLCISFSLLSWLTWPCLGCALSLYVAVEPVRANKGKWALYKPSAWSGTSWISPTRPWLSVAAKDGALMCKGTLFAFSQEHCLPSVWVSCGGCSRWWGCFPLSDWGMGTALLVLRGEKNWTKTFKSYWIASRYNRRARGGFSCGPFHWAESKKVQSSGPHHRLWHAMLLSLFYIQGIGEGFNQNRAKQKWQDWIRGELCFPVHWTLTFKINN